MNDTWILVYSKFSDACKSLLNVLEEASLPFDLIGMCIDNAKTRRTVLESKKFNIASVPCIIHVRDTGVADVYEGAKTFALIQSIVSTQTSQSDVTAEPKTSIDDLFDDAPPPPTQPQGGRGNAEPQPASMRKSTKEAIENISRERASMNRQMEANAPMAFPRGDERLIVDAPKNAPKIESKRTGAPIDIASAMAGARDRE